MRNIEDVELLFSKPSLTSAKCTGVFLHSKVSSELSKTMTSHRYV